MHSHEKRPDEKAGKPVRAVPSPAGRAGAAAAGPMTPDATLDLQRSVGNLAVSRALDEDQHKHDAGCGHSPIAQRRARVEEAPNSPADQRALVDEVTRAPGEPLAASEQKELSSFYGGFDFSHVRKHTGPVAQRSAEALGARAYTVRNHIVSGMGNLDKETLGHEAGHVRDQALGPVAGTDNGAGLRVSDPRHPEERAQDVNGAAFAAGAEQAPVQRAVLGGASSAGSQAPAEAVPIQRMDSGSGGYYDSSQYQGGAYPEQNYALDYEISPAPRSRSNSLQSSTSSTFNPLDESLGTEVPGYWSDLDWHKISSGRYWALLPVDSPTFKAIEQYARDSQEKSPYSAPAGEATRMKATESRLKDDKYDAAAKAKMRRRLREGKSDGLPAPKSKEMNITAIKVYANKELWPQYIAHKTAYDQSLVQKQGDGQGYGYAEDPSSNIPWSTGSRPDLGGTAATVRTPGYENLVSGIQGMSMTGSASAARPGEAFYWHGTDPSALDAITSGGGFDPNRGNRGTAENPSYPKMGQGVYMADTSSKAQTYANCSQCGDPYCDDMSHPPRELMVARGMLGYPEQSHLWQNRRKESASETHGDRKSKHKHRSSSRSSSTSTYKPKDHHTSVVSKGLKKNPMNLGSTAGNEFLFKNRCHIYPEFRVYFR